MASVATLRGSPTWDIDGEKVRSLHPLLRSHGTHLYHGHFLLDAILVLIDRRLRRLDSSHVEKTLESTATVSPSISASVSPSVTPSSRETYSTVNQTSTDASNSRNHGLIHAASNIIDHIRDADVSVRDYGRLSSCSNQLRSPMLESATWDPATPSILPMIASSTCQEESPSDYDIVTNC
jgi:hypothetical protein